MQRPGPSDAAHGGDRKSEIPEEKSSAQIEHLKTCEQIASEHGVSERTVRRAAEAVEARERLTPAARVVVDSGSVSHVDLVKLKTRSQAKSLENKRFCGVGTCRLADERFYCGPHEPTTGRDLSTTPRRPLTRNPRARVDAKS